MIAKQRTPAEKRKLDELRESYIRETGEDPVEGLRDELAYDILQELQYRMEDEMRSFTRTESKMPTKSRSSKFTNDERQWVYDFLTNYDQDDLINMALESIESDPGAVKYWKDMYHEDLMERMEEEEAERPRGPETEY